MQLNYCDAKQALLWKAVQVWPMASNVSALSKEINMLIEFYFDPEKSAYEKNGYQFIFVLRVQKTG